MTDGERGRNPARRGSRADGPGTTEGDPAPDPAQGAGGSGVSRRTVLVAGLVGAIGGAAVGAAAGAGALNNRGALAPGGTIGPARGQTPAASPAPLAHTDMGAATGFTYLNPLEVNTIQAAAARIIPTDANGPGATEAGVVFFIDRQLSARLDFVGHRYMQGPFAQGNPTQGDQTLMSYRDRYRLGVLGMESIAQRQFSKPFAQLSPDQQDTILKDMEAGRSGVFTAATLTAPPVVTSPPPVPVAPAASPSASPGPNPAALATPGTSNVAATAVSGQPAASPSASPGAGGPATSPGSGISAQAFFQVLRSHVMAGFLADPVHGGNRGMVGWKLIGFPGVQNYTDWIGRYGVAFDGPYMSIADHQRPLEPNT